MIKGLILLNGQDIIGDVIQKNRADSYHITNPLAAIAQPGQDGQLGLGFLPWPIFSDDVVFDIDFDQIVVSYNPRKEVIVNYNQMLEKVKESRAAAKTGLALPQRPRLIVE